VPVLGLGAYMETCLAGGWALVAAECWALVAGCRWCLPGAWWLLAAGAGVLGAGCPCRWALVAADCLLKCYC
jgi:hypothetical protein